MEGFGRWTVKKLWPKSPNQKAGETGIKFKSFASKPVFFLWDYSYPIKLPNSFIR